MTSTIVQGLPVSTTGGFAKPIRVMIFPDRPDCILFYVPDGEALTTPPLAAPFNKKSVADAFAAVRANVRLTESTPGRWTESMKMMRKAEKAERFQLQKQREAAMVVLDRGGGDLAKTRAEAIARKHGVDERIRDAKDWIKRAKSNAATRGQYEDAERFRRKERELSSLQTESLAIQQQLGDLRKQEKAENVKSSNEEMHLFKKAAYRVLSEQQFEEILRAMADMMDEEEASQVTPAGSVNETPR